MFKQDDPLFWSKNPDIVPFGSKFTIQMPKYLQLDASVPIFVSDVNNPYKFWFNIGQYAEDLENLMEQIE